MKKIYYIIAAASVMLAASCAKEQVPSVEGNEVQLVKKTFTADFAVETKTSLVDGKEVHWTKDDQISVFDNVNNKNYVFKSSNLKEAAADFTGYIVDGATEYVAVFPYKYGHTYASATRTVTAAFPQIQKAVKGGFDTDVNLAVAISNGEHFSFKNVCALMKVTIPNEMTNVRTISLANEGARMSGKLAIALNADGKFTVTGDGSDTNSSREVSLDGGGKALDPGDYYIVVMPGQYKKLFLAVTTTTGEQYVKYSTKTPEIKSNQVINLGDVPSVGSKQFKLTGLPSGPVSLMGGYTIGYEAEANYLKKLWCDNKQKNVISSVPETMDPVTSVTGELEFVFNKRPGPGIVDVVYDNVRYPVLFDVRPLYKNHFSTFNKALSSGSTITVGENYLEVTTNTSGDGNLSTENGNLKYWLAPSLAPILCVRLEDPRDMDDVKSANVGLNLYKNFEFNGSGGTFRSTLNGAAKYNLPDGSAVLIWDLREDKVGSNLMPEDFMADGHFRLLVEKITDTAGNRVQKIFKFYGFSSFMSLEDALSHFGITE